MTAALGRQGYFTEQEGQGGRTGRVYQLLREHKYRRFQQQARGGTLPRVSVGLRGGPHPGDGGTQQGRSLQGGAGRQILEQRVGLLPSSTEEDTMLARLPGGDGVPTEQRGENPRGMSGAPPDLS